MKSAFKIVPNFHSKIPGPKRLDYVQITAKVIKNRSASNFLPSLQISELVGHFYDNKKTNFTKFSP